MKVFSLFPSLLVMFAATYPAAAKAHPPSMTYFLIPDKKSSCTDDFPEGLSFFFQELGGFEDKAEVAQVSRILKIDLSVFQDVGYNYEDKAEVGKHWHNLTKFASIVDSLIAKIEAHPQYYKKVIYNPGYDKNQEKSQKIILSGDTAKIRQYLENAEKDPRYYYPPDRGYLKEGRILRDLYQLKVVLDCYRRNGVTKVRLEFG